MPSIRRWRIDFKISELVVGELTNMREVPARRLQNPPRFTLLRDAVSGDFYWLISYRCQSWLYMHNILYRATAPLIILVEPNVIKVRLLGHFGGSDW